MNQTNVSKWKEKKMQEWESTISENNNENNKNSEKYMNQTNRSKWKEIK